jgi:8-oxo-dGTP pyrophosphatase MutT (NUDIX family)
MPTQPNNQSTKENPVGRFMVAVGAVIEQEATGKILIVQRSADLDWQPNEWEILYGRIDQFEDAETGLRRETKEEIGLTDLTIVGLLSVWHIFRGSAETADNELIGITFHCRTSQEQPTLSSEHQAYKWATPKEALELVKVEGIRRDIAKFMKLPTP